MWKSPNGTIRAILDGTVFRTPIIVKGITPYIPTWTKPITIARHAYGDVYKNTEMRVPEGSKAELVVTDENGNETVIDKFEKKTAEKGSVIKSFDCNGFIDNFDDITYDVSFLTEDGDLIAVGTVCKYNHVTFPSAPKKDGYRFVRWAGDTENITSSGACYAVYEEGEEPSSESGASGGDFADGSLSGGDNGGSKGGCGSSVTGVPAVGAATMHFMHALLSPISSACAMP